MEFLDGPATKDRVAKLVQQPGKKQFAVAFWGKGAVDTLELGEHAADIEVVCNLLTGGTNPDEISYLRTKGIEVRHSSLLHAKVYLFPDCVIIGSSNASANGLSYQGIECRGWSEANLFSDDPNLVAKVSSWFTEEWEAAPNVDDTDLEEARKNWEPRRDQVPPPVGDAKDLLDALGRYPTEFDGRRAYVVVYKDVKLDDDANDAAEQQIEARGEGKEWSAFQDWKRLPTGAPLLSIHFNDETGELEEEGYWEIAKGGDTVKFRKGTIEMCYETENPFPKYRWGKKAEWREALRLLMKHECWDQKSGAGFISFGRFAREIVRPMIASVV